MAWVYPAYQHLMTDSSNVSLTAHAALRARPILTTQAFVYDEGDVTVGDVRANGGSGLVFSSTGSTDYEGNGGTTSTGELLASVLTTIVTDGVDVTAAKTTFLAIATEAAWDKCLIYDATTDTDESTRIAICVVELDNITPNGSAIDVSWSGTDPGAFMTSRST